MLVKDAEQSQAANIARSHLLLHSFEVDRGKSPQRVLERKEIRDELRADLRTEVLFKFVIQAHVIRPMERAEKSNR